MLCSHRFSWEKQFWIREYIIELLVLRVFPNIEQDIGALFRDLGLRDAYAMLIIVPVPMAIEWILHHAHIVAIC